MVWLIPTGLVSDKGRGGGAESSQSPTGVSQVLHTSYSFSHTSGMIHYSVKV